MNSSAQNIVVYALTPLVLASCLSAASRYAGPSQAQFDEDLRKRAAFDLSCSVEAIQLTPLVKPNDVRIVTTQGVSGCDKKATYVLLNNAWVLNSKS